MGIVKSLYMQEMQEIQGVPEIDESQEDIILNRENIGIVLDRFSKILQDESVILVTRDEECIPILDDGTMKLNLAKFDYLKEVTIQSFNL